MVCIGLMLFLPADTWIRLLVWMLIGLDVYDAYGIQHSHLEQGRRRGYTLFRTLQMCLAIGCIITGFWHQQTVGWDEGYIMMLIAVGCGLFHIAWLLYSMFLATPQNKVGEQ